MVTIPHKVIVCTNAETLLDSYEDPDKAFWAGELCEVHWEAVDSRLRTAAAAAGEEVSINAAGVFADWHGGRYSNQAGLYGWHCCGCVLIKQGSPAWLMDAAWSAHEDGCKAIEEFLASNAAARDGE